MLTKGTQTTAIKRSKTQQPEGVKSEERRKPTKEEEDCAVETVPKIETHILTIRCYIYRLKFEFTFEFTFVIFIYSYTVCTLTSRRKGGCDMTSYYVLIYIRAKNSSTDNLVPVNSTTIQHTYADLFT